MNIEILNNYKKFFRSDYNEGTEDELSYYIDIQKHKIGDTGYLYLHQEKSITEMSIVHIITNKTIPINMYDRLIENDDVLINGEEKYNADTSAEFITDDECMLIWFRVVDDKPPISCDVLKDRFVTGYVGGLIYDHFTNKTYNVSKSKVKGNNSTVIQNLNTNNEDGF